jgi:hypothetical protein
MIKHFDRYRLTWLLMSLKTAGTAEAPDYLQHCSDIVCCGKVPWFTKTKQRSFNSFACYRFDLAHRSLQLSACRSAAPLTQPDATGTTSGISYPFVRMRMWPRLQSIRGLECVPVPSLSDFF